MQEKKINSRILKKPTPPPSTSIILEISTSTRRVQSCCSLTFLFVVGNILGHSVIKLRNAEKITYWGNIMHMSSLILHSKTLRGRFILNLFLYFYIFVCILAESKANATRNLANQIILMFVDLWREWWAICDVGYPDFVFEVEACGWTYGLSQNVHAPLHNPLVTDPPWKQQPHSVQCIFVKFIFDS